MFSFHELNHINKTNLKYQEIMYDDGGEHAKLHDLHTAYYKEFRKNFSQLKMKRRPGSTSN